MKKRNKKKENPLIPAFGAGYAEFLHRKTRHKDRRDKRQKRDKLWNLDEDWGK